MRPDPRKVLLSHPMRDLLWSVAQHKHGWTYVRSYGGGKQIAQALERRGLVTIDWGQTHPTLSVTELGRAEIKRRWPISPFVLGTYEHQPNGYTPRRGVET